MTALPPDVVADLSRLVAELEQRLEQSFAAHDEAIARQAAAAQENARLRDKLAAAQEREAASAAILRTISGVSGDAERSLPQIAEITARLFGASSVRIRLVENGEWGGTFHVGRSSEAITSSVPEAKVRIGGRNLPGTVVAENRQIHIPDLDNIAPEMADWPGLPPARAAGARTVSGTPLRRDGNAIGVLLIHRDHLQPFSEAELALQQNFADQAAVAVENSRLFNETREALERQTATADILKVIASSPSDIQPVFEAIATSANRLVSGFSTTVFRFVDGRMHLKAFTPTNPAADELLQASFPRPLAEFPIFELVRDGQTMQFADTEAAADVHPFIRDLARSRGYRSMLFTPLMSNGTSIGMIGLTRPQPGSFAPHHVQLLQTFADQAVIAIENVRLFDEVQARTNDLSESLQQQTATADVLKVISRSAFDLQTVLETLTHSAVELSGAMRGAIFLRDGDVFRFKAASSDLYPEWIQFLKDHPQRPGRNSAIARSVANQQTICVPDVLADPEIEMPATSLARIRAVLAAPMLRDGRVEGVMVLSRPTPGPFTARQIELVQTFADQAMIAIENVRLFDEVQARTNDLSESLQQQIATADVLKVISRSVFDLQTVLDTLVESAYKLCGAGLGLLYLRDDETFECKATAGVGVAQANLLFKGRPIRAGRGTAAERVILTGEVQSITDFFEDPEFDPKVREAIRNATESDSSLGQLRSTLAVPMTRDDAVVGVMVIARSQVGPFPQRQIELLQTFADQAVIAIENVRLFDEVQQRTRELAASLDELRTAQDRLVQTEKLASLGQLTAGIAHEIKNPLNFVNNFAALSAELTDELNDVLKPVPLDDTVREEIDELTGMLKGNLEKVVQHGQRADSIVKNMLLHSREGSGDHRPTDINALLDESLNLAYHGARAEKPQFNVTLQRNFDPNAGMIELFPQEITRVFLNLIANGFYAVNKRKTENNEDFDPVVSATTTDRGNHVEIRIRDNGIGIPDEVKEKMFNPFFTTKPAGEGTGLGLSMSHDIVVKQHGGTIDVTTEPGQFTEFTIVLPRTSNPASKT